MKNLVKVQERHIGRELVQCVSARDLHFALGSKKDFTDWIKARITKYGFIEGEDYVVLLPHLGEQKTGSGGANKAEYFISIDMAKELSMVEATQKGREVRQYFIACEKELLRIQKQQLSIDWQEARANSKCIRSVLNKSIQALSALADKQGGVKNRQYYSSVTKMIYKELFGDSSLKDVRNKLDIMQMTFLTVCEQTIAQEVEKLVELEIDYHDIYQEAKRLLINTVNALSITRLESKGSAVVKLAWENGIKP